MGSLKFNAETIAALAATLLSALLLVLTAANVGPLWRDETNTINVAQAGSLRELWQNIPYESFPPLWPLILRGCCFFGLANNDAGIRILGLYVGLLFLGALWLNARWMGSKGPTISIALLGFLPAFIFIIGANRAYGLASVLMVFSFGTLWRMVQNPSRGRIILAGASCFLFAHCVYYDAVFLAAMLAATAVVALRGKQWKTLAAAAAIGAVSFASLAIYQPVVRKGSEHLSLGQLPSFSIHTLWVRFGSAVTLQSSGESGANGPEVWMWMALLLAGVVVATWMLCGGRAAPEPGESADSAAVRVNLAVFCAVCMVIGSLGHITFLYRLRYLTQTWYYVEMLCLIAICLDGLFGANWKYLRPGGLIRIGFLATMIVFAIRPAWAEAHTRRSNVDLIATVLNQSAEPEDLIIVQTAWEGITFDRYYHGRARWITVPPIDTHKVHRTDVLWERMNQQLNAPVEPMAPILTAITNTLQNGHCVWVVGNMVPEQKKPTQNSDEPVQWEGVHLFYWLGEVTGQLMNHAARFHQVDIPSEHKVCELEDLPLSQFVGYRAGTK